MHVDIFHIRVNMPIITYICVSSLVKKKNARILNYLNVNLNERTSFLSVLRSPCMKSALDECMKKLVKVGTHRNVDCTYVGHSFFKRSRIYSFNKSFILRNICARVEKSNVLMLLHEKTDYE